MPRLPARSRVRTLEARVQQLSERLERLEGNQSRIQTDVTVQLQRADIAVEDLVAALESLRARVDTPDPAS
jgi:predicted nuclease with TOPRIM domain